MQLCKESSLTSIFLKSYLVENISALICFTQIIGVPNCNEKRENAWKILKGKNVHFFNDIHLSLSLIRISLPALQDSSNQNCDEDDLEGKGDS